MPEINVFLFDLAHLMLLFKCDKNSEKEILDYEENNQICMAQIRLNLFSDVSNEKQKAFI